ncbi:mechanosensitive ion channel family protein [Roseibium sediminis]|uniref:mechanosensitive ion channel family protein n=1 Tax=Roseibium sediminis TaxID=1775174 RepID=UPI00123D5A12|nr:mechanosensitive ion channel domain-containing protein [Roseibium sediminis]
MDFQAPLFDLNNWSKAFLGYVSGPWLLYQLIIIVVAFALSRLLSWRIEPVLEEHARGIEGQPGLLRMVVVVLRRTNWIIFAILLFGALSVMRELTWPSRSHFVAVVLYLTVAWLFVSILSRIIRNRLVAKILSWLAWVYAALVILGLDDEATAFLDSLALPLGQMRISALLVLKAAIFLMIAVWIAVIVGRFLDQQVQKSEELTPSIRVLIGKVVKIGLVLIAGAIALSSVGIDLTVLTVFSGAVGLGLGFGLQKVISNFISGIIILLDKSIKPGDTISLEGTFGWIRELRARFVSVVTRDGREYLIPNEDFITHRVINWSFSDDLVRLDVNFGVSYDADPHKVTELAIAAAKTVFRVHPSNAPVCWLTGFGDSSLDFVLRFWISDPQKGLTNIRGQVLLALWDTFKEHDIGIPYPHREIIMKEPAQPSVTD